MLLAPVGNTWLRLWSGAGQTFDASGKDGRADGFGFPTEQEFYRGAADTALAGAHAATGVQLGFAPSGAGAYAGQRDVFTAADQSLFTRQSFQFLAQCEGAIEYGGEPAVSVARRKERGGARRCAGGSEPRDFALQQRQFQSADSGGFARRVDALVGGLLLFVYFDAAVRQAAAEQRRHFGIRDQAESAGQVVAALGPGLSAATECDGFEFVCAAGLDRPAGGQIGNPQQGRAQAHGLHQLAGMSGEAQTESQQRRLPGLFRDQPDTGAVLLHIFCDGQQQRNH